LVVFFFVFVLLTNDLAATVELEAMDSEATDLEALDSLQVLQHWLLALQWALIASKCV
jgi:hypothetical protein